MTPEQHEQHLDELEEKVGRWRADPVEAAWDLFEVELDPWQRETLTELLTGRGRVAVRACHGPGKTTIAAMAIIIFAATNYPYKIPCTSPSSHQLRDILWAELAKWVARMPPAFAAMFVLKGDRFEFEPEPKNCFAVARTARPEQPDALQGFHSENLLAIVDEAPGVHDRVFEVARGALTGANARVLMIGNPTRTQGYFYDAFHADRALWHCIKVSAYDSARVSSEYIDSMAATYGAESNVFRSRVLGEFPNADDNAVLSLEHIEESLGRGISRFGDVAWGLDVARFGDDRSALAKTCSNALLEPIKWWAKKETTQTVGIVVAEYDATPEPDKPTAIYVDSIGIGAGVVDQLAERRLPVVGVNVSEAPSARSQHNKLRDELWWLLREWFEAREVQLPERAKPVDTGRNAWQWASMDELISELVMPTYALLPNGKIKVESKEDTKKRVVPSRSPDLADALMLTRYHRFSARPRMHGRAYRRESRKSRGRSHPAKGLSGIV